MDRFVIFNKATGKRYGMESYGGYKEWNTERAAKAALTRLKKKSLKAFEDEINQHMDFIIKIHESGEHSFKRQADEFSSQAGRDAYLEERKPYDPEWRLYEGLCGSEVVTYDYFYENEPMVERTNLMGGNKYMERLNTPYFLSPSRDSYYR